MSSFRGSGGGGGRSGHRDHDYGSSRGGRSYGGGHSYGSSRGGRNYGGGHSYGSSRGGHSYGSNRGGHRDHDYGSSRGGHRDRDYGSSRGDHSYGSRSSGGHSYGSTGNSGSSRGGSRRSDYSFDRVNEWHNSKQSSGENGRGWSISDNSKKSGTIQSSAVQKSSVKIDGVTDYAQEAASYAVGSEFATFTPRGYQTTPEIGDDLSRAYTSEVNKEMKSDVANVIGLGKVDRYTGVFDEDYSSIGLSKPGQRNEHILRNAAKREVERRDTLTGSKLGDGILSAAASFAAGPIGGIGARAAIAAGSAANMTDSHLYRGEPIKHRGSPGYGGDHSSKSNPTNVTLNYALKNSKGNSGDSSNIVPPKRDNSIGIGTGSLSGRVSDFSGSLAIKPKRNGRRGRI